MPSRLADLFDGAGVKRERVIDRLRRVYPDVTWTYVPHAFMWDASDGSYAVMVSAFGDEDGTSPGRLCRYWPDDKSKIPEWVPYTAPPSPAHQQEAQP